MMFGSFDLILVLLLAVGIGFFLWLRSREEKRAASGAARLPTWRLLLAAVFGLVALFSGGCTLLFLPDALRGTQYVDINAVLLIGGIPFMITVLLLWLSLRRGTPASGGDTGTQSG